MDGDPEGTVAVVGVILAVSDKDGEPDSDGDAVRVLVDDCDGLDCVRVGVADLLAVLLADLVRVGVGVSERDLVGDFDGVPDLGGDLDGVPVLDTDRDGVDVFVGERVGETLDGVRVGVGEAEVSQVPYADWHPAPQNSAVFPQ